MLRLYNILQILLFPILLLPLIILLVIAPQYRDQFFQRLGVGLQSGTKTNKEQKTIWIHAFSVDEVRSAHPLIAGLRQKSPDSILFFSSSSTDGNNIAQKLFHDRIDHFIPFPFDILPVINRFLERIKPDLFILVETDFWPNILAACKRKDIPTLLVNGRISDKAIKSYLRFSFFFKPLFSSFHTLSMQTEKDRQNLIQLHINQTQIKNLGNLQFDTPLYSNTERNQPVSFTLPKNRILMVAGYTHEGEEEIILQSYKELKISFPDLYLIIAPRTISRGPAIQNLALQMNLTANCRSLINAGGKDLFILDTIGELNSAYSHAQFAFIGGSLVAKGGHNPINAAVFSIPTLFGPHMENFLEVSDELVLTGGAIRIRNQMELTARVRSLLQSNNLLGEVGSATNRYITAKQGVIQNHLTLIQEIL
jgi:3-deoxy-D-manno-octulosonic-acid transferase